MTVLDIQFTGICREFLVFLHRHFRPPRQISAAFIKSPTKITGNLISQNRDFISTHQGTTTPRPRQGIYTLYR